MNEIKNVEKNEVFPFEKIKPETRRSFDEITAMMKRIMGFEETERSDIIPIDTPHFYSEKKKRLKYAPKEISDLGKWTDEVGDSLFIPNKDTERGKITAERLKKYEEKGINYINGEPDFSRCSEATVQIENMTDNRPNNFKYADQKLAQRWNDEKIEGKSDWRKEDITKYRKENKLSWHERSDIRTMDLVHQDIHGYFKHTGGCYEYKIREHKYEKFD